MLVSNTLICLCMVPVLVLSVWLKESCSFFSKLAGNEILGWSRHEPFLTIVFHKYSLNNILYYVYKTYLLVDKT